MKKIVSSIAVISIMTLTSCANIIHGTSDQITLNSLEKDTTIYVDGTPRGRDNATVDVKRGNKHTIRATKKGCQDISAETVEKFDATSLLGILIDFGIITIPIDLISGAAWKTEPTTYTISPICKK
jgi:hypothetical protein